MDRLTYRDKDGMAMMKERGGWKSGGIERLAAYEDTGLEPNEIEQQLMNFSSFLSEMTHGHMSKTNYTVEAMVSEANDCFERVCDECADLEELFDFKKLGSIDHLRDLLQAEQDGRLVVLPSKTVWELTMDAGPDCDMKCPVDAWDEALGCDLCSKAKLFAYERPCTQERLKELGKTVFLTREEAEAALAGKGEKNE